MSRPSSSSEQIVWPTLRWTTGTTLHHLLTSGEEPSYMDTQGRGDAAVLDDSTLMMMSSCHSVLQRVPGGTAVLLLTATLCWRCQYASLVEYLSEHNKCCLWLIAARCWWITPWRQYLTLYWHVSVVMNSRQMGMLYMKFRYAASVCLELKFFDFDVLYVCTLSKHCVYVSCSQLRLISSVTLISGNSTKRGDMTASECLPWIGKPSAHLYLGSCV